MTDGEIQKLKGYYTEEKLLSLKEEAISLVQKYRSSYKELWNGNHTFSKYIPVYCYNSDKSETINHPFSSGNYHAYLFNIPDVFEVSLEKPEIPLNDRNILSLHYYHRQTYRPFYSVYYIRGSEPWLEEFHINEENAVINIKYKAVTGEFIQLSKETIDECGRPVEFFDTMPTEDKNGVVITNHYHYEYEGNTMTDLEYFFWYNTRYDILITEPLTETPENEYANPTYFFHGTLRYDNGRLIAVTKRSRNIIKQLCLPWFDKSTD